MNKLRPLIPNNLCTRCGACFAADKTNLLSKDHAGFPQYLPSSDSTQVSELLNVCSGEHWNYKRLLEYQYGPSVAYDPSSPDIGTHRAIFLLSGADVDLRARGQSGGVTTTLLEYGFDTGLIDAVLAVRRPKGPDGDPFAAEPFIARTKAELLDSCGSKYTVCSTLELVSQIAEASSKFALTALPCQTVGFKRLALDYDKSLSDKCKLVIGPYCGLTMETEAGHALAIAANVNEDDVRSFENRGGAFPGKTTLTLKSDENRYIDRTAHRILYRMYAPMRCYTCTDYGNELADLAVADCWEMVDGKYKYPEGAAYVICRSERGEKLVKDAIAAGRMLSYDFDVKRAKERWKLSFMHRKVRAHNRIRYWKRRGQAVPKPDYPLPPYFKNSRMADLLEMATWRLFRMAWLRRWALRIWVGIASAPVGSCRNLIFEDCKFFLFTHAYEQFTLRNFARASWRYLPGFLHRIARKLRGRRIAPASSALLAGPANSPTDDWRPPGSC